jgi:endonuclease/exonuclease/phosphatase family metal-dependent hydrolase
MIFSVLLWNIWLDNQNKGNTRLQKLFDELSRIIVEYNPDVIALNEVLQASSKISPEVTDFLQQKLGYTDNFFTPASPLNKDWLIGDALCSRLAVQSIKFVPISDDTPAKRRGYESCKTKAIVAKIKLSNSHMFNLVIAHPMHIRPYTLKDHYDATSGLNELVRSEGLAQNTILCGDFNEPGFMPKSFKTSVSDVLEMRTGGIFSATWRHNAYPLTPIRANLDQVYWTKKGNLRLLDFKVLSSRVSDHRPILAVFNLQ